MNPLLTGVQTLPVNESPRRRVGSVEGKDGNIFGNYPTTDSVALNRGLMSDDVRCILMIPNTTRVSDTILASQGLGKHSSNSNFVFTLPAIGASFAGVLEHIGGSASYAMPRGMSGPSRWGRDNRQAASFFNFFPKSNEARHV